MAFVLAWLLLRLHAFMHAHFCIHLLLREDDDIQHYLLCGCGRVFWPHNWIEADRQRVERLNQASARLAARHPL